VVKFYFATSSAEVPAGSSEALVEIVKAVQSGNRVLVSGFHDASGDPAKNAELAKQRAMAVGAALKMAGVPDDKVELAKPAQTMADGPPAEARRVEVKVQ
jgi:K(+)-stimulated pyrophosphate-energized sodium pump